MKHLSEIWPGLGAALRGRRVILFLDYDGTLTPIVAHPRAARLSRGGKKTLQSLVGMEGIAVAIVSGRTLKDLKQRVGIPGLIYVGNHGLEVESPTLRFTHPQADSVRGLMAKIKGRLRPAYKSFRGIHLEEKVFSLSVHYRNLAVAKVASARLILEKIVKPYLRTPRVVLVEGKKVWEIRPALQWNKGTTVLWLYGRILAQSSDEKILPVFFGDDRTDEDAFRSLKPVGMSVKVAEEENEAVLSDADCFVRSPREVFQFLEKVKSLKSEERTPEKVHAVV